MQHITVLKEEAIELLNLHEKSRVVDCTYGGGGHSELVLRSIGDEGKLLCIDLDENVFASTTDDDRLRTFVGNFKDIESIIAETHFGAPDAILADLGWRSDQFEESGKGFSFSSDEPLLMTFGNPSNHVFTAHDVVNNWDEENLADIIYGYGEERAARKIAKAIVEARTETEISSAKELADIVDAAAGRFYRRSRLHPATKTFQAIRMAVNDELNSLKKLLQDGFQLLTPAGRIAIISFHSLEDRIVKHTFRDLSQKGLARLITKKPVIPTKEEISINPRARSAKLRVLEKI